MPLKMNVPVFGFHVLSVFVPEPWYADLRRDNTAFSALYNIYFCHACPRVLIKLITWGICKRKVTGPIIVVTMQPFLYLADVKFLTRLPKAMNTSASCGHPYTRNWPHLSTWYHWIKHQKWHTCPTKPGCTPIFPGGPRARDLCFVSRSGVTGRFLWTSGAMLNDKETNCRQSDGWYM